MRVTPVLVISAFPMAQNVIFPLALMYPTRLLSSHFYTEEVQVKAHHDETSKRQGYFRPILRFLTTMAPSNEHKQSLSSLLNDSKIPNPITILSLLPLFSKGTDLKDCTSSNKWSVSFFSGGAFDVMKLSAPHVKLLMSTHKIRGSILWFPRFRLQQYANLVHQIDMAIAREGGPKVLNFVDLKKACHLRGLNVQNQNESVMQEYLQQWLSVTLKLDALSMSLLLHLPILLGYNHASRIWDKRSIQ